VTRHLRKCDPGQRPARNRDALLDGWSKMVPHLDAIGGQISIRALPLVQTDRWPANGLEEHIWCPFSVHCARGTPLWWARAADDDGEDMGVHVCKSVRVRAREKEMSLVTKTRPPSQRNGAQDTPSDSFLEEKPALDAHWSMTKSSDLDDMRDDERGRHDTKDEESSLTYQESRSVYPSGPAHSWLHTAR
jgi:hypothetical protein